MDLFRSISNIGSELVNIHLGKSELLDNHGINYPEQGTNLVISRYPRYYSSQELLANFDVKAEQGRVYINEEQYFSGIEPNVWSFDIGGYQVLDKWLRDRKRDEKILTYDDVLHYEKTIKAISETIHLMAEIDAAIPKWPIE